MPEPISPGPVSGWSTASNTGGIAWTGTSIAAVSVSIGGWTDAASGSSTVSTGGRVAPRPMATNAGPGACIVVVSGWNIAWIVAATASIGAWTAAVTVSNDAWTGGPDGWSAVWGVGAEAGAAHRTRVARRATQVPFGIGAG